MPLRYKRKVPLTRIHELNTKQPRKNLALRVIVYCFTSAHCALHKGDSEEQCDREEADIFYACARERGRAVSAGSCDSYIISRSAASLIFPIIPIPLLTKSCTACTALELPPGNAALSAVAQAGFVYICLINCM